MRKNLHVVLAVAVTALALAGWRAADRPEPVQARWEYKLFSWQYTLDINTHYHPRIERDLNELGAQGWELVSVMPTRTTERTSDNPNDPAGTRAVNTSIVNYFFKRMR